MFSTTFKSNSFLILSAVTVQRSIEPEIPQDQAEQESSTDLAKNLTASWPYAPWFPSQW